MTNTMTNTTVIDYLQQWSREQGDRVWLRDRQGDDFTEWTWRQAEQEINAVGGWLEERFGHGANFVILSRNRAHWILADMATCASGNCTAPIFTTQNVDVAKQLMEFVEAKALFLGEADNWERVCGLVPEEVEIITFPGVEYEGAAHRWEDLLEANRGREPSWQCRRDDVFTLTFTSGTTGMPKGVMQTHDSMLYPMYRCTEVTGLRQFPRLFSYLPMAHVGERELVWVQSLLNCGEITFIENMTTLLRDLPDVVPHQFFAAPRVWEQLSQMIQDRFGGAAGLEQALAKNPEDTKTTVQTMLGLQEADYVVSASAPIPATLIRWFDKLAITIVEGYGMSEANAILATRKSQRRIGSIGQPAPGVEVKLSDEGELLFRGSGMTPGYYKNPEKTAETIVDGWLHTGDKMRVDEDGFYYITGRVKEYFKTIHGKYVAPQPIEAAFSKTPLSQQQCLLGRGYSKTVVVCVLSPQAEGVAEADIAAELRQTVERLNRDVEGHMRVGAVIVSDEAWSIENGLLTVTLKMKREEIEAQYGELAQRLARQAAEQGNVLIEFA